MSHTHDYPVVRFSLAGIVSVVITFLLFLLMQDLIRNNASVETNSSNVITTIRAAILEPRKPVEPRIRPTPPDIEDRPLPPPQLSRDESLETVTTLMLPHTEPEIESTGTGSEIFSPAEGDILSIVKVQPIYPRKALINGIEGFAVVEFTVTASGTTRDIRIVESDPATVFDQSSIQAAGKFKYKPRVINGNAVEVRGVRNLFTYTLE